MSKIYTIVWNDDISKYEIVKWTIGASGDRIGVTVERFNRDQLEEANEVCDWYNDENQYNQFV
jgi:hypothetical protein